VASHPVSKLTEAEYLAIERAAEFRSEFVDGEMFAMSGGTNRHGAIQGNLFGELYMALRGSACRPFGSDSRVKVSSRAYVYPDVTVVCTKPQTTGEDSDILLDPVAIFEVLSPSTEKYDRGLKFQLYRSIDSLKEYVLVNQEQVRVEQFTRERDGTWTFRDYQGPDEAIRIDAIGVVIALQRIYDQVEIPPDTN
jgi:Uma2 family endonuclease